MGIYKGSDPLKDVSLAGTSLNGVYLGSDKIWPTGRSPTPNTLAYYTFDTQTLLNSKTNTVDATWYSGNGSYSTGYKGQGYSADISSGGPIALSLKIPSGDFTICSCLKFNTLPTEEEMREGWFGNQGGIRYRIHCQFYYEDDYYLQFYQYGYSYSGTDFHTSALPLTINTRYRCVFTRSGTTIKFYLNGNNVSAGVDNTRNSTQTEIYYLGAAHDLNARKFKGQIDNVIIENRAWSDDEVRVYDDLIK